MAPQTHQQPPQVQQTQQQQQQQAPSSGLLRQQLNMGPSSMTVGASIGTASSAIEQLKKHAGREGLNSMNACSILCLGIPIHPIET